MDGVVPAGEGLLRSGGGGFGRVSGPASTCVWAVRMAQIQGTVPAGKGKVQSLALVLEASVSASLSNSPRLFWDK